MTKLFGKKNEEAADVPVFDPLTVGTRLKKWFPDLSDQTIVQFVSYQGEIVRFSRAINLVAPNTLRTIDSVHTADSILASRLIEPLLVPGKPIYDFGSGNGFPGLVFAALYPNHQVVLLDRDQRKLEFCKHVASNMKLTNINFEIKGIEELDAKSVYNVMSRGLASLQKAMLLCRKPVAQGGKFFHLKGDAWANELAQVPSQLFSFWSPNLVGQYRIPDTSIQMSVVLTEKIAE